MKNWPSNKKSGTAAGPKWVPSTIELSASLETLHGKPAGGKRAQEAGEPSEVCRTLEASLIKKIACLFDRVVNGRKIHFQRPGVKRPTAADVDRLIESCIVENAITAREAGLVAGPWGMVSVVPELAVLLHRQVLMAYDIGVAHGKQDEISRELLAGIVMSALGTSASSLIVMQGGKVVVERLAPPEFQAVIVALAGKVAQHALKSGASHSHPIAGAALMAWLSGLLPQHVGKLANEIFQQRIETSGHMDDDEAEELALALVEQRLAHNNS